jgi:hypothetical protein
MAKAVLSNKKTEVLKNIEQEDFAKIVRFNYGGKIVKIDQALPFRVKFTTIGIEGYSSTNVPPIPLQVIGFSNYIL